MGWSVRRDKGCWEGVGWRRHRKTRNPSTVIGACNILSSWRTTPAVRTISYRVPDPEGTDHTISLPLFGDSPVVMIQDSKHALKTMRNNLFSGARALILGSHLAMYSYAWDLAFTEIGGHPLYHCDVQKMDRQSDDNAATLDFVRQHHPDRLGFAVYLFVMGEVVDAYQSRNTSHRERVRMALRCRYFLRLWRRFLQTGKYPETRVPWGMPDLLTGLLLTLLLTVINSLGSWGSGWPVNNICLSNYPGRPRRTNPQRGSMCMSSDVILE